MANKTIQQILNDGVKEELFALFTFTRAESVEAIVLKFNLWGRYFFPKYFSSPDAEFHKEIDTFNTKLFRGDIKSFTDIAFRGAAKTTRTKLFYAFWIANEKTRFRKYLKILSKDGGNSQQSVTDIYNMLIEPRVLALYPEVFAKTTYKREETMKSFTTATGIRLLANTVNTDQRGQLQEDARPDVIWFDDFETRKTLKSAIETKTIWDNMEEARTGLAKEGGCIYTSNYLSERGNVHKLVIAPSPVDIVLIVPLLKGGKSTWPARFPDDEAKSIIERAEDGAGEYQCNPAASKDVLIDRTRIDRMPKLDPLKEVAGFRIYRKYDASHRYGGGADVAGGVGLDSSTHVIIDFDTVPAQVVACFDDNEVKPDTFGDELARQGEAFGECILGVENNKFDMTIGRLKQIYPEEKIYKTRPPEDKVQRNGQKPLPTYGWSTNALTKPKMVFAFCKAVNDGLLELNDPKLTAEARAYTRNDLMDSEIDPRLTTRHFDLFVAACIAWQMKDFAEVPSVPQAEIEEDEPSFPDIGI